MRILIYLFLFFTLINTSLNAQKITISGYVKDGGSKEVLIGASVVNANTKSGTSTNQYGYFSFTANLR